MSGSPWRRAEASESPRPALLLAAGLLDLDGTPGTGGAPEAGAAAVVGAVCGYPLCGAPEDLISHSTSTTGSSRSTADGGWYTYGDKSGRGSSMPRRGGAANPDLDTGNPNCSSGPGSLHVIDRGSRLGSAMGVDFAPRSTTDAASVRQGELRRQRVQGHLSGRVGAPIPFLQVSMLDPCTAIPSVVSVDQQCIYDSSMPDRTPARTW